MNGIPSNICWAFTGIFSVLILSSVIVFMLREKLGEKTLTELNQRIKSWWIMVLVFGFAMVLSRTISLIFFAFISFLATKEFFSMIPTRRADRRVLFWVYLTIPVQYWLVACGWYGLFIIFIPMYMFLFLPMRMIMIGETAGFVRSAGTIHWGLMKTVFCLSHCAALLVLSNKTNPNAGGAALVLFLVVLTQCNDVAQYIWGKNLGGRKVMPKVSPGKTWAGLIGGAGTTALFAFLLAPFFTPFTVPQAVSVGLLIGVGGFMGDVVMSAVKRDVGVKDSGSLLPGHGGILDRIDSLTYTAPLFFHFVYFFSGERLVF